MSQTQTHPDEGVTINFLPSRFWPGELKLIKSAAENARNRSPRFKPFADWLLAVIENEEFRRASENTAAPIEIEVPMFDAITWTSEELVAALELCGIIMAVNSDRPMMFDFFMRVNLLLCQWVNARLGVLESHIRELKSRRGKPRRDDRR